MKKKIAALLLGAMMVGGNEFSIALMPQTYAAKLSSITDSAASMIYAKMSLQELLQEGNRLFEAKQYGRSRIAYEEAIKRDPSCADAHVGIGKSWWPNGEKNTANAERAKSFFEKAITVAPENPSGYFWLGIYYDILDQQNEALSNYTQAANLASDDPGIHYWLGQYCEKCNNYTGAINAYETATELFPENINFPILLAESYTVSKSFGQALQCAEEYMNNPYAEQSTEYHVRLYHVIGVCHLQQSDYPASIEAANQAIAYDPNDVKGYRILAKCYELSNDIDNAIEASGKGAQIAYQSSLLHEAIKLYKIQGKLY